MGFWEKKNTVSKSFFRLTLPKGWAETSVDAGVRFQDETGSRSLLLREIVYPPTPGAEAASVLAFVTNEYRESLDHVLPSPHHLDDVKVRDAKGLLRMAFAASREEAGVTRCFFVGTTARATVDGGFRLITAYYEDFTATTLDAVERAGTSLLASLEIPDHAAPARPRDVKPSDAGLIQLAEGAVVALCEALGPGDVVWVAVERSGPTGFTYVLDVRAADEVPEHAVRAAWGDVPIAVDERSVVLLRGATIDYVPGQGFRFDSPNANGR
jgi:Fe-S cluster assembly iron-binding protein IscA